MSSCPQNNNFCQVQKSWRYPARPTLWDSILGLGLYYAHPSAPRRRQQPSNGAQRSNQRCLYHDCVLNRAATTASSLTKATSELQTQQRAVLNFVIRTQDKKRCRGMKPTCALTLPLLQHPAAPSITGQPGTAGTAAAVGLEEVTLEWKRRTSPAHLIGKGLINVFSLLFTINQNNFSKFDVVKLLQR